MYSSAWPAVSFLPPFLDAAVYTVGTVITKSSQGGMIVNSIWWIVNKAKPSKRTFMQWVDLGLLGARSRYRAQHQQHARTHARSAKQEVTCSPDRRRSSGWRLTPTR